MEASADVQLQTQLDDNNYDETELISLKIPVSHLSYYQNTPTFQSVNGKIDVGGMRYRYVKRRIYNDSLEVLCIPDAAAMKLKAAKNNFFASVNGLQHEGANKKQSANANVSKDFSPEYYPTQGLLFIVSGLWSSRLKKHNEIFSPLSSAYARVPERPPRMAAAIA
jgi:hypothetical protein